MEAKAHAIAIDCLPDDLKLVPQLFGRDVAALRECVRDTWIERALRYWRQQGFPYPSISESVAKAELARLAEVRAEHLERVLSYPSMVGLRLANSFHPQMWAARIRGRTPLQIFANDAVMRRCLGRAVRFWPNRRCWNARSIRILVSIQNRARVSNFRPTVARALIDALSSEGAEVLDFSAGYGGRLLAALTLPRRYVGIDPASAQCDGLRRMAATLGGRATIMEGCAEDVLPGLGEQTFDLVLSSPPYFRLERYSEEATQSFQRYQSYNRWVTGFLVPTIEHAHRVLRRGGRLALNVSNLPNHPIAVDAASLASRLFGSPERVFTLMMSSNPADKARRGKLMRTEPIFVFRK